MNMIPPFRILLSAIILLSAPALSGTARAQADSEVSTDATTPLNISYEAIPIRRSRTDVAISSLGLTGGIMWAMTSGIGSALSGCGTGSSGCSSSEHRRYKWQIAGGSLFAVTSLIGLIISTKRLRKQRRQALSSNNQTMRMTSSLGFVF